ncbi:MAG: 2-phosphosulfolactate phosphatase [Bacteroidales bacterium]|nr:2-phosphosulfolactate phosphatase [Bacteroidales bacterium]
MSISVISTAQQAQGIDFSGKTAIVIDVLRATSVITTALENGAQEVVPVKTIEEAKSLFATCDTSTTLRGGERNALKIEGFDLGNSPLEYTQERVGGKTVILTTTNGTNAINNVKGADEVVLACFRNAAAVADYIIRRLPRCDSPTDDAVGLSYHGSRDVVIVCAGTEGRFSLDDGLCAGMLIELMKQEAEVETDDLGLLLSRFYNESKNNLLNALSGCYHLKRLFALGFYDDIKFCLQTNCVTAVPLLESRTLHSRIVSLQGSDR